MQSQVHPKHTKYNFRQTEKVRFNNQNFKMGPAYHCPLKDSLCEKKIPKYLTSRRQRQIQEFKDGV